MRVIDFVSFGAEDLVYLILDAANDKILWRGTRQEFIWEMSAFFLFFHRPVARYDVDKGTLKMYI